MTVYRDKRDGEFVVRVDLAPTDEENPILRDFSRTITLGVIERMVADAAAQRAQLPPEPSNRNKQ